MVKRRLQYDRAAVPKAFEATQKGMSVYRAAKKFRVPESTLRDRTRGLVSLDARPGFDAAIFSKTEEQKLVGHIKHMAAIGHGYNKKNIQQVAKEYALFLGKEVKAAKELSNSWYYGFTQRWPEVTITKPKKTNGSESVLPQDELDTYYKELGALLSKSKE